MADQNASYENQKNELEGSIREIKDEIESLIHFQKVRDEIEAEEVRLSEKVQQQKREYEEKLEKLEQREKADFIRMKKDMIQSRV